MTRKKSADRLPVSHAKQEGEALRRVMVRISETDYSTMMAHFAEEKDGLPAVTVHAPSTGKRELTDEQREKRKAYRNRPEVKDKMKAYRKQRAAKVRALLAHAKQEAGS